MAGQGDLGKEKSKGRAMATRKRPRNSNSSSTLRRTPSVTNIEPPQQALRSGSEAPSPVETGGAAGLSAVPRRPDCVPVTETAAFLQVCGFCGRGLGPGRETFIYLGEVAFCSRECREQQLNFDEHMEMKRQSGKGSTIAAA